MDLMARVASMVFGVLLVVLAVLVTADTVLRKAAGISLQGTDELGGYVLAVGSCLAFTVALVDRAHIRIDLLHNRLPLRAQALLNVLTAVLFAGLGLFLVRFAWIVVEETVAYRSTAATPWATPLIYPQSVWFAGLVLFGVVAVWLAVRAVRLLLVGDVSSLNRSFGPMTVQDEIEEELADVSHR
jgi:TRAP-type C4-dicarboxylate transport system permease small subunit